MIASTVTNRKWPHIPRTKFVVLPGRSFASFLSSSFVSFDEQQDWTAGTVFTFLLHLFCRGFFSWSHTDIHAKKLYCSAWFSANISEKKKERAAPPAMKWIMWCNTTPMTWYERNGTNQWPNLTEDCWSHYFLFTDPEIKLRATCHSVVRITKLHWFYTYINIFMGRILRFANKSWRI